jgi:hypothetical protein
MDSNDKMMMELLMQDEAAVSDQEHRMIVLTTLICYQEQLAAVPRQGGSRVGNAKNKNQQRLAGAILLDSDYFGRCSKYP